MNGVVRWFRRHDTFWATSGLVQERFFSSPIGVVQAGIKTVQDDRFWKDVGVGYALAVIVAIPFGVVSAEFVASNAGLGFMVSVAGQTFDTARVMAGIFILITAGIGTAEILGRVERRFDRWRA